jgi:4-hydroxy-tetrahydrodipicolinate synthase
MKTKLKKYTGATTAIVTPMIYGEVDKIGLGRLIDWQIKNGIDNIVPCGTTGESATLTTAEQEETTSFTVKRANGRVPVIAGAGANNTQEAIELTKMAKNVGADAVLSVSPYYNRPSEHGKEKHFLEIANECDIPIILYNVPSRTGSNISPATVIRLAQHQNIIGIKEASGDLRQISQICQGTPDDFIVLSGDDFTCLPTMAIGGQGVVSVVSNVVPKQMTEMVHHGLSGDFQAARKKHEELFNLMAAMFCYPSPAPAKKALELLNIIQIAEVRLPMTEMDEESNQELISVMRAMGLI